MTISQRVFYLLKKQGKKQNELSKFTGISTSTISAWNKRGTDPSADTISTLADFFEVTTDYLLTGKEKNILNIKLEYDEQELLDNYKKLSSFNKGKVSERAKILAEIEMEEIKKNEQKAKEDNKKPVKLHKNPGYIESYTLPASAGTGVDLDACERIILKVRDKELISEANFAVRISGNSMEPEFHDGEYALVQTCPKVEQGNIGIFTVNSDGYIKKLGVGELISLNPKYENIQLHEYDDIRCRGEVIGTLEQEDIISTEEY